MRTRFFLLAMLALGMQSCCFVFDISDIYDECRHYSVGNGSCSQSVDQIEVSWVNGNVEIVYGDDNNLYWEERITRGTTDDHTQMRYRVNGNQLQIHFCESGKWNTGGNLEKQLRITLPKNSTYQQVQIETVSANISADMDAEQMQMETVSGNVIITNLLPANQIEVETVSGNVEMTLPSDAPFNVDFEAVSGSFSTTFEVTRNGSQYTFGRSGGTDIDVESVSGSLFIQPFVSR